MENAVPVNVPSNGIATIAVSQGKTNAIAHIQRGAVETSGQGGDQSGNGIMEVSRAP